MRTFNDSEGKAWTVFEVRRVVSDRRGTPVQPAAFGGGWLCFENSTDKRRLVHFPERWREAGEPELRALLADARPAPRTTWRLDDLTDIDTAGELRAD